MTGVRNRDFFLTGKRKGGEEKEEVIELKSLVNFVKFGMKARLQQSAM